MSHIFLPTLLTGSSGRQWLLYQNCGTISLIKLSKPSIFQMKPFRKWISLSLMKSISKNSMAYFWSVTYPFLHPPLICTYLLRLLYCNFMLNLPVTRVTHNLCWMYSYKAYAIKTQRRCEKFPLLTQAFNVQQYSLNKSPISNFSYRLQTLFYICFWNAQLCAICKSIRNTYVFKGAALMEL